MDLDVFFEFLVVDVFDDKSSSRTDIVVRAESRSQLVDFALALGEIHASLFYHFLATALLSLYLNVMVSPNKQSQFEILSFLPLRHNNEIIFSNRE